MVGNEVVSMEEQNGPNFEAVKQITVVKPAGKLLRIDLPTRVDPK